MSVPDPPSDILSDADVAVTFVGIRLAVISAIRDPKDQALSLSVVDALKKHCEALRSRLATVEREKQILHSLRDTESRAIKLLRDELATERARLDFILPWQSDWRWSGDFYPDGTRVSIEDRAQLDEHIRAHNAKYHR